jgi:hypothetical protein
MRAACACGAARVARAEPARPASPASPLPRLTRDAASGKGLRTEDPERKSA